MRIYTRVLTALITLFSFVQVSAQDCTVDFDLFGNDTICRSSVPFNLPPVAPFGGVYSGPGVVNYDFFDPQNLEPGDYTLYYTYTDEICSATDSVTMTVLPANEVLIEGPFTACIGDSITFYSPQGKIILWPDQSLSVSWTILATESFYFDAYSDLDSQCPSVSEYYVRLGAYPDSLTVQQSYSGCPGDDLELSFEAMGTLNWNWFDGSSDTTVTVNPEEDTDYFISFFGEYGCDTTFDIHVDIDVIENFIVTVDQSICVGDTLTVYQEGAALCKIGFTEFTDSLNLFPTESFELTVIGLSASECATVFTTDIYVGPIPQVVLSGVDDICYGESIQLSASGSENFLYYNLTDSLIVSDNSEALLLLEPTNTADYILSGYNNDGCSQEIPFQIVVHPLPQLVINPLTAFCIGQDILLEGLGAESYLWNNQFEGDTIELNSLEDFELSLTGISSFGCVDSIDYSVEVHPVPVVGITGPGTVCEADTVQLFANGADYYIWESLIESDSLTVIPLQDTIITLVGTTVFGCQDFTNLNMNVLPAPVTIINGDNDLCIGDETMLTVTSDSPYTWSDGTSTETLLLAPLTDTLLVLTAIGSNGCDRIIQYPLAVHDLPVISVTGVDTVCYGETVVLHAAGAITWEWSSGSEADSAVVSPVTTTNYRATGWNEFNCPGESIFQVVVNPTPIVFFEFNVDAVCDLGPSLTWIANPAGGVLSGDGVIDNWFDPGAANVGENNILYTVTNEFNCSASASESLIVDDCSSIGFTPDENLSVYPLPADDIMIIESGEMVLASFTIHDMRGALVMASTGGAFGSRTNLDVSGLASGVYTLSAEFVNGKVLQQKIVKR